MKHRIIFLQFVLSGLALILTGCGAKTSIDACKLVTKEDADSILKKPTQFDKQATDKLISLSSSPGVCVYSIGPEETAPKVVVGFRGYDSLEMIKAGFTDSKDTVWKKKMQEPVTGVGDDAVLLDGKLIALRNGKTWLQIGAETAESTDISTEALKSVAKKAASLL